MPRAQARRHAVPAIFGSGGDGDPRKSFGDWCLAVARNDRSYLEKHYGSTFNEWQHEGGPRRGVAASPAATRCRPTSISSSWPSWPRRRSSATRLRAADGLGQLQIPYLDVTTVQSAGVTPFFGGVQMYWTAEAQTRTETEPQFKQLELKA